jgi:hypothetical protein
MLVSWLAMLLLCWLRWTHTSDRGWDETKTSCRVGSRLDGRRRFDGWMVVVLDDDEGLDAPGRIY